VLVPSLEAPNTMTGMNKGKEQISPEIKKKNIYIYIYIYKNSNISSNCSVEGGGVVAFPNGVWGPRAAKGRPLSSKNHRFRLDPLVFEAEGGWGSGHGHPFCCWYHWCLTERVLLYGKCIIFFVYFFFV
jgi:hypothetical protein